MLLLRMRFRQPEALSLLEVFPSELSLPERRQGAEGCVLHLSACRARLKRLWVEAE